MILVDSNIFMYAAGVPHANKEPCSRLVMAVAGGSVEAAVDAEVLQEILHRYRAIGRQEQGLAIFDDVRRLAETVLPITADVMDEARAILERYPALDARDAVHAAVCKVNGIGEICSYDRGFDHVPGLRRREP